MQIKKWSLCLAVASSLFLSSGASSEEPPLRPVAESNLETTVRDAEEESVRKRQDIDSHWVGLHGISPEYKALLDTIAWAEGADYNVMYGGGKFNSFKRHPNRKIRKWGLVSSAAGRYQFMPKTYRRLKRRGLFKTGFNPEEQDRAALYLAKERGVNKWRLNWAIKRGDFGHVWNRLAPEWASLPTYEGKSYHDQGCKSKRALKRKFFEFYQKQLDRVF